MPDRYREIIQLVCESSSKADLTEVLRWVDSQKDMEAVLRRWLTDMLIKLIMRD